MRGFKRNQINYPNSIYLNVKRNKINTLGVFENETPTYISATHAFLKIRGKFENRIPRELNQNFDIPRISMIH